MLPATAADAMDGGPDDPGDADFKVSQKREFQHADFSGFARLFDALQVIHFPARVPEKETNPYKSFSRFLRHVESFLQAALPSAWFKLIFSQGW